MEIYSGVLWKKLLSPFHHPHLPNPPVTPFPRHPEKQGGSRVARVMGATLESPAFSPGVSKTESQEDKNVGNEMDSTASSRGLK
jgi:hypothetical protein